MGTFPPSQGRVFSLMPGSHQSLEAAGSTQGRAKERNLQCVSLTLHLVPTDCMHRKYNVASRSLGAGELKIPTVFLSIASSKFKTLLLESNTSYIVHPKHNESAGYSAIWMQ